MDQEIKLIEDSGADWVHLDVMDGNFVPVITFGPKMIKDIRPLTELPFDVHLMIDKPSRYIKDYIDAGADYITIHYEAELHINMILNQIRDYGCKSGISIIPSTSVNLLDNILPFVDLVLVMSVNPGFGGQQLIDDCLMKVEQLVDIRDKRGLDYQISIDGGVNRKTGPKVIKSGVDVVVMGSAFFGATNPREELEYIRKQ